MKKYLAELVGTFVLTFLGCGAAVALGCDVTSPATVVGAALAFGLALSAMYYTIGGVSGCHVNPAVTLGVFFCGRISMKDCWMYMLSQVIGAVLAAALLLGIVVTSDPVVLHGLDANTCAFDVTNGLIVEIVLTTLFVLVYLGATAKTNGATGRFAGVAIGLALILVHLVGIRFTGTSVNPARSIGPAIFTGGQAFSELWVFIVGPLIGGALASLIWRAIDPDDPNE